MRKVKYAEVRQHVERVRKQLRARDRGKRFVLKPGGSKWLIYWDTITAIALLYTATLTPFEVAFLSPAEGAAAAWSEPWFLINRSLDVIFSCDICLNFFLAYYSVDKETGAEVLVESHERIARHYLTSWFPIDAFTVLVPSSFDIYIAHTSSPDSPLSNSGANKLAANASILRVLRILRLFKLVRLARASRIIKRWRAKITLSNGTLTLLQCCCELFIATHWYACFFSLQAAMAGNIEDTWLGSSMFAYCESEESTPSPYIPPSKELSALEGCPGLNVGSWYLAAFSWSIMVITGTGGTGLWPSRRNDTETAIVTFLVVIGAFLWTTVLARFCEVATNSNPGLTHFRQSLDDINDYSRVNNLPDELATRLREYMHEQRAVQQKTWAEKALPQLSTKLQVECLLHCHKYWLDAIWFVRDFDKLCKVKLAQSMTSKVLVPGEVAPRRHMYVIVGNGLVMFGMKVLHRGNVWGDDVILEEERHFSPYTARAMSYCEVSAIIRHRLLEVVGSFPASMARLRRANLYLALRRHIVNIANEKKQQIELARAKSQKKEKEDDPGTDFVTTVQKAAQELGDDDGMTAEHVMPQIDPIQSVVNLQREVSSLKRELTLQGERAQEAHAQILKQVQSIASSGGSAPPPRSWLGVGGLSA